MKQQSTEKKTKFVNREYLRLVRFAVVYDLGTIRSGICCVFENIEQNDRIGLSVFVTVYEILLRNTSHSIHN